MKKLIFITILLLNFTLCFAQDKVFLPSENSWATIINFSEWYENNPHNYYGSYKFIHSPNDNNGEYNGEGDGYYDVMKIEDKAGKLFVYSYGEVEGWSEAEIDTMKNPSIQKNYLISDNQNVLMDIPFNRLFRFTILEYKNKKGKIKKTKGIMDMYEGDEVYFYELISNSVQGKKDENINLLDNIGKKISALLPQGAYLREYEKLIDVKDETYIGIYVTDFKDPLIAVKPQDQFNPDNWFYTCPEATQGQSLTGKYFLFAYKNNQITSTAQIPANVYDSNELCSISLYNTPSNNCWYFSFLDKNCKGYSKSSLEKSKLIQLMDLTGDAQKNEFILTGVQEACGFIDRLSCGFDEKSQQVMIYPILHHAEKYYWVARFVPIGGDCTIVVLCDDHYNETYERCDYKFNTETKQYDLVYEVKEECK